MSHETTLDRFGRVILPKEIRDRLGLAPGAVLEIVSQGGEIHLKPVHGEPSLSLVNGVLVFTGRAEGDLRGAVRAHREGRLKKLRSRAAR